MTFDELFAKFGRRLPVTCSCDDSAEDMRKPITASNIYYSNLHGVGKLYIKWVQDAGQHLDLDERNRTLSVFAYPSYCALVCLSDPESTSPLSR